MATTQENPMEMSPQSVRSAEFKTVRKGADPDEVQVFLNDVADELERAQNQSSAMEARARAAVARLQEVTEAREAAPAEVPAEESETITRTLLLAQRTADTTVAEARGEAARIVAAANNEAATTLDSTREMAAQLIDEARTEARRAGEAERLSIASEVESLKARRDFLESDVEQLELFIAEQRSRIREAATALVDLTERVPGGLGATRAPLLSASEGADAAPASAPPESDRSDGAATDDNVVAVGNWATVDDGTTMPESIDDEATLVNDATDDDAGTGADVVADNSDRPDAGSDDPTTAMPVFSTSTTDADRDTGGDVDDDFRFSFDDDQA
jgi:DivIVA domain-containing protein